MRRGLERLRVCNLNALLTRRLNVHPHARLTSSGRARIVARVLDAGRPAKPVAAQAGVSERTVRKWLARLRVEGAAGPRDRSSRPHHSPRPPPAAQQARVFALRLEHRLPAFQIARACGLSKATVSRLLRRHGLPRHSLQLKTPAATLPLRMNNLLTLPR